MKRLNVGVTIFIMITLMSVVAVSAGEPRIESMCDPNHFTFRAPEIGTKKEWNDRKRILRETLLLRAGLWPMPEKCPLNPHVFDERRGDGFTVAKVYFESLPGFFVTGNLYRPTLGAGPYPAIVTPHGHWKHGRLENGERGSIPGRCIDFARMGYVVFSIDMVGYNDSFQLPHDPNKSRAQLAADKPLPYEHRRLKPDFVFPCGDIYGFTLGGIQLWNGIRSIDFLQSLPDVDDDRIGVTGASGGATQTIFLMVADDRVKVAAPVNIIGAAKHPGCLCENMSGMWLDASTVELAASFSPRPLLLMSATEDPWTPETPTRELPMIRRYYMFDGAADMVHNVHVNANHNYNADTRAAVYRWFAKHLDPPLPLIENPAPVASEMADLGDLRVFPDGMLPSHAQNAAAILNGWKAASNDAFRELLPVTAGEYSRFTSMMRPMMARALAFNSPGLFGGNHTVELRDERTAGDVRVREIVVSGEMESTRFSFELFGDDNASKGTLLIVAPHGELAGLKAHDSTVPGGLTALVAKGYRVALLEGMAGGPRAIPRKIRDSFLWSNAYNPSNELWTVHDVSAGIEYLSAFGSVSVAGLAECGLPVAFACAAADIRGGTIAVDLDSADPWYDGDLDALFPVCGLKRIGGMDTALLLMAGSNVVLMNPGGSFDKDHCGKLLESVGRSGMLSVESNCTSAVLLKIF